MQVTHCKNSNISAVNGLWWKWMKTEAHSVDRIEEENYFDGIVKIILDRW